MAPTYRKRYKKRRTRGVINLVFSFIEISSLLVQRLVIKSVAKLEVIIIVVFLKSITHIIEPQK